MDAAKLAKKGFKRGSERYTKAVKALSNKVGIDDIPEKIKGARVLLRADFNCPMKDGKFTDYTKIVSTVMTIKLLLEEGAKSIVIMSHLGRPNGQRDEKLSFKPIV